MIYHDLMSYRTFHGINPSRYTVVQNDLSQGEANMGSISNNAYNFLIISINSFVSGVTTVLFTF